MPTDRPPLPTLPLGHYRHYQGGEYEVLGIVRHSETLAPLVLYRPLRNDSSTWVCPFSQFLEPVLHEGRVQSRFSLLMHSTQVSSEEACCNSAAHGNAAVFIDVCGGTQAHVSLPRGGPQV